MVQCCFCQAGASLPDVPVKEDSPDKTFSLAHLSGKNLIVSVPYPIGGGMSMRQSAVINHIVTHFGTRRSVFLGRSLRHVLAKFQVTSQTMKSLPPRACKAYMWSLSMMSLSPRHGRTSWRAAVLVHHPPLL